MAYIVKNKNIPDWKSCSVNKCGKEASYIKDEAFLLCKNHSKSRLDVILEKSKKEITKEDKEFIQKYVKELNPILKKLVEIFNKGKNG